MCRINITLNTTTGDGSSIISANGRYRKVGDIFWEPNFNIDLNNARTPQIGEVGSYELQVNVTNNIGSTSKWSPISTFNVSRNCSDNPIASTLLSIVCEGIEQYPTSGAPLQTINVEVSYLISWSVVVTYLTTSSVGWISLSNSYGTGVGTITYDILQSTPPIGGTPVGEIRYARITVTDTNDPTNTQSCDISQTYYINGGGGGGVDDGDGGSNVGVIDNPDGLAQDPGL